MGLQFCGKGARTADGEEGDIDPLCVERQPRSLSSTSDSWGALIRACGWNCTGTHADDGPAEETGITVCDTDTLFALPLSFAENSICLSLES